VELRTNLEKVTADVLTLLIVAATTKMLISRSHAINTYRSRERTGPRLTDETPIFTGLLSSRLHTITIIIIILIITTL
jgi:hypothetical protein